ncbi:MAG: hypothetical protein H6Q14_2314 [Bacteroidetes bacterium]|nr:hypothetical protein [Bacteroidota bacterium]
MRCKKTDYKFNENLSYRICNVALLWQTIQHILSFCTYSLYFAGKSALIYEILKSIFSAYNAQS